MANKDAYRENYDRIFGDKPVERGSWVMDPELGRLVPKAEYYGPSLTPDGPTVMKPLEPFVSPIDGRVISDRSHLRQHNKEHGVTNISDYGENNGKAFFERKAAERAAAMQGSTPQAKQERINTILRAMREVEKR